MLARVVAAAAVFVLASLLALTARLAAGPLAVTWLARDVPRLSLASASLAWEWRRARSPVVLTLRAPVLKRRDGSVLAQARQVSVSVLPAPLLIGLMRPVQVSADTGSVALLRTQAGEIGLDRGPGAKPAAPSRIWLRLRQVALQDVDASVTDRLAGLLWHLHAAKVALGGLDRASQGSVDMTVAAGGQSSRMTATLSRQGAQPVLTGGWSAIDPARLGASIAPVAAADLPVAGQFWLGFGPHWQPQRAAANLSFGAGVVHTGAQGVLPVAAGQARLEADFATRRASLTGLRLTLNDETASLPVLSGAAAFSWAAQPLHVTASVELDHVAFAALGKIWPAGVLAGGRDWVVANITSGVANALHADLGFALDATGARLTDATGQVQAQDLTLVWLRPMPPLIHANATLTLLSPDALLVTVPRATQTPSDTANPPITLTDASLRITGLDGREQDGVLESDLSGPVAQVVALLSEKRLNLLSKQRLDLGTPGGSLVAHVQMRLPLDDRVTIDRIAIHATGQTTSLHLGGVLAGRDLDDGALALAASNDGLTLNGTARLAGIPSTLAVRMDFRGGPADQVVATYHGAGTAGIPALQAAGVPVGGLADGTISYDASLTEQRGGAGTATVHVDLRGAGLGLSALGWRKPADTDSAADAVVALDHDRVVRVDHLSVTGPDVSVQGHATAVAGQPMALDLDQIVLGRTRAAGTVLFPTATDPALHITLHGSVIDLSSQTKPDPDAAARPTQGRAAARAAARQRQADAATQQRGRPWTASMQFDRVLLTPGADLTDVAALAVNDGLLVQRAQVSGRAGGGAFHLTVVPQGGNRALHGTASDAGGFLRALDLTGSLHGGTLALNAVYDDTQPDHPLTGTAQIDNFRVAGAPAVARLLQAMTLYGVVDVLRGPGLGFTHLVAPFRLADNVLRLDDARAFSGSLGLTAKGDIDLTAQRADLTGTIVPAYFFNTLLGKLPVLGHVFSPEQGGGVFAAAYTLNGALADPLVRVNPLAALTPGFLRGVFGLDDAAPAELPVLNAKP